jgi:hypothetical protein
MPVALFSGDERTGAAGDAMIVVNDETLDEAPQPPAFPACTLQKYCLLLERGPTAREVPVSDESSTTYVEN